MIIGRVNPYHFNLTRNCKGPLRQYIRYMADRRLNQIGFKAIYGIESNPLPWLDWVLNGDTMSNFFEKRVTDYSASAFTGTWGWDGEAAAK